MANQPSRIIVPVAVLFLAVVGILLLVINTEDLKEGPQYMYGIVLDAGSSHTGMFIYKWPADKENGTGIVTQHSECHINKGISSFADQRGGAAASLEECMDKAVTEIPKNSHPVTPVYLGATAGMRLLNITDPKQSDVILKEVENKLKTYPFNFKGAVILTGQMEGAYGWVTVNYLSENFIKYGIVGRWLAPNKQTVGALDLGGASTQITFETNDKVESDTNKMTLQLYGQDYHIYTHSFLCYGRDQMLRQLLAQLVKNQGGGGGDGGDVLINPCYPKGYNFSTTLAKLFDTPCTSANKPSPYNGNSRLQIQGSGNYQQCLGNITQIFSFDSCSYSKCSFNQIHQPNVTGNFMAFSAFYYAFVFLKRSTDINVNSSSLLKQAALSLCNMTFQEMSQKFPEQHSRLQDFCAVTVFMQVLLLQGYGFDDQSFQHISFQRTAGGTSIGWALGYMLSLSNNLLPSESLELRKALHPGVWKMLIFLWTLVLIMGFIFLIMLMYKTKKQNSSAL